MMTRPVDLLRAWLTRRLTAEQNAWLDAQDAKLGAADTDQAFYLAISLVPRMLGKADLDLAADDLAAAEAARTGWTPLDWSVDQAGRLYLLLTHGGSGDAFAKRLGYLMASADVAEEITFLRGLPLYPDPDRHEPIARKGCRTNMRPVFEAVAHHNPYPAERFDDNAWNHLVLKALFVGSTLHPIQRFDQRANAELARIMRDYAHERWAAHRPVTPEIWRGVGRFADRDALADLDRVLASTDPTERLAAALALRDCPHDEARARLKALTIPQGAGWDNLLEQGLLEQGQ